MNNAPVGLTPDPGRLPGLGGLPPPRPGQRRYPADAYWPANAPANTRRPTYGPKTTYGPMTRIPRPVMLSTAVVATMVASFLWLCGFTLFWMVILASRDAVQGTDGYTGTYHLLNSVHMNLIEGGAAAAYVPSLVALVLGPMLLIRRPLPRTLLTVWGVIAVIWIASWLWRAPTLWAPAALYIGLVVLVTWTPDVGRWYRFPSSPAGNAGNGLDTTPRRARMTS